MFQFNKQWIHTNANATAIVYKRESFQVFFLEVGKLRPAERYIEHLEFYSLHHYCLIQIW